MKPYNCNTCNKYLKYKTKNCLECTQKKYKKPPAKESVKVMSKTKSFVAIGKKYGVSDNAVRKWVKSYKKYNPEIKFPKKPGQPIPE